MSKIADFTVERIIDCANDHIVDIIEKHGIRLKKKGSRYFGLCPFHDDHHATNFSVYKKCYKCFACDAKGDAITFLMQHGGMKFIDAIRWVGNEYGIPVDDVPVNYTPPQRKEPEPLPMFQLPITLVMRMADKWEQDTLIKWICSLHWDASQSARIDKALNEYHIGHSKYGHTIFWQIDEKQTVRTGKMMLYQEDGHRAKKAAYNFDFIHAALFRDKRFPQYDDEKFEVKQCLFGQHLLNAWPSATINIVESEKTALLMAIAHGNNAANIWMACGGLYNLTAERLAPLIEAKRKIVLFPDRDGIKSWKEKAAMIPYKLSVNTDIVTKYWQPIDGEKADIADVVIRMLNG